VTKLKAELQGKQPGNVGFTIFAALHANVSIFYVITSYSKVKDKSKIIPVLGRRGLWDRDIARIPNFVDNRLTDGGEVVSLKCLPRFTFQGKSC
jgi:hypothetical protein